MARLAEAVGADLSGYEPISKPAPPMQNMTRGLEPVRNAMLRCPLPPVSVTPDSLRQFYAGGQVPQTRLLTPPQTNSGSESGGGTIIQQTTVIQGSTSSGSGTVATLAAKQVAITTPVLDPAQAFTNSVLLAKSFQLLVVSASGAARVELYGTIESQGLDLGRDLDEAPNAGTAQNLISDVALDTAPYQWTFQNRIGANADSPQTSLVYVTISNIGDVSQALTVTLKYVPLES